jgi:hypothetical protein
MDIPEWGKVPSDGSADVCLKFDKTARKDFFPGFFYDCLISEMPYENSHDYTPGSLKNIC